MTHLSLTPDQTSAIENVKSLLNDEKKDILLLSGRAGTGKTTIAKEMVRIALDKEFEITLMAYTNSASNNFNNKVGYACNTIHSTIYDHIEEDDNVIFRFKTPRKLSQSLYIIDEASLIPSVSYNGTGFITPSNILQDLILFCREECEDAKFIFIGDCFQLPPVNESMSAALDKDKIKQFWTGECNVLVSELTQIHRQKENSEIITQSSFCLDELELGSDFNVKGRFSRVYEQSAIYNLATSITDHCNLDSVSIAHTNKSVNIINCLVRNTLNRPNDMVAEGDHLAIYQTCLIEGEILYQGTKLLITNCESSSNTWAGIRFQEITFSAEGHDRIFNSKINLDVLFSLKGSLYTEEEKLMKHEAIRTNKQYRECQLNHHDPYLGAIRARFSYAMTAHKAQGQEFDHVYIHPIWIGDDSEFKWRWLYTSITRARLSCELFPLYSK